MKAVFAYLMATYMLASVYYLVATVRGTFEFRLVDSGANGNQEESRGNAYLLTGLAAGAIVMMFDRSRGLIYGHPYYDFFFPFFSVAFPAKN